MTILFSPQVTVNSVDLTNFVEAVELKTESAPVESANAGGAGWVETEAGLKKFSITIGFKQSYASGAVHATLGAILGTNVVVTVGVASGATSATNPMQTGTVTITEHIPIMGSIGDHITNNVTWPGSGALVETVA